MSRAKDRIRIASEINTAASLYKKHLVGKRFMYVFDNRYIEVIYKSENFRHLTGVDTPLSASQFYRLACRGHLSASQIGFSAAHPYDLCVKKVAHKDIARYFMTIPEAARLVITAGAMAKGGEIFV